MSAFDLTGLVVWSVLTVLLLRAANRLGFIGEPYHAGLTLFSSLIPLAGAVWCAARLCGAHA